MIDRVLKYTSTWLCKESGNYLSLNIIQTLVISEYFMLEVYEISYSPIIYLPLQGCYLLLKSHSMSNVLIEN